MKNVATENVLNAADMLRAARQAGRLTQAELAIRCRTSQATVSDIERGRRQPSVELLDRLLRACDHRLTVVGPGSTQIDPLDLMLLRDQAQRPPAERLGRLRQLFQLKGLAVPPSDPPAKVTTTLKRLDMRAVQLDPEELLKALTDGGVDFVVIGGIAALLRGDIVTTEDVDVAPRHTPDNFAALAQVLNKLQAPLMVSINELDPATLDLPVTANTFTGLTSARFLTEHGVLDVALRRADGRSYEHWETRASPVVLTNGAHVLVAALDDIIASKAEASQPVGRYALARLRTARDLLGHEAEDQ